MKTAKKLASASLAALFATAAFTAAVAAELPYARCEQDLTERDGGKIIVNVVKKDNGLFRVDQTETSDHFGIPQPDVATTLLDNVTCERELRVLNQETGELGLKVVSCVEEKYNADGKRNVVTAYFNDRENTHGVSLRTFTRPPRVEGGYEIGMIPQATSRSLGAPKHYEFSCTATLLPK